MIGYTLTGKGWRVADGMEELDEPKQQLDRLILQTLGSISERDPSDPMLCFVEVSELSEELGLSHDLVQTRLDLLERQGWVVKRET